MRINTFDSRPYSGMLFVTASVFTCAVALTMFLPPPPTVAYMPIFTHPMLDAIPMSKIPADGPVAITGEDGTGEVLYKCKKVGGTDSAPVCGGTCDNGGLCDVVIDRNGRVSCMCA